MEQGEGAEPRPAPIFAVRTFDYGNVIDVP
jgi:hypothetical protein